MKFSTIISISRRPHLRKLIAQLNSARRALAAHNSRHEGETRVNYTVIARADGAYAVRNIETKRELPATRNYELAKRTAAIMNRRRLSATPKIALRRDALISDESQSIN